MLNRSSTRRKTSLTWGICAFALMLSLVPSAASATAPLTTNHGVKDAKELEAFTDRFFDREDVKKLQVPGAAVVVVQDGKVTLQKGYGYADVEKQTPVDPANTVFRLGSLSKALTATAVMQLVEQQKIDLHADINKYMGDVQTINSFAEPVTMEHLLTHTTGFDFTEPKLGDISFDLNRSTPLKDYIAANMPTVVRKPGESYNYDNFASMLQGYIVQQVSGVPYHQYMDEHLFKPLDMQHSSYLLTDDVRARLAKGYTPEGKPYPLYTTTPTELPQGGLFSTPEDMSKFMIAQLNLGAYGSERILEEKTARDMQSVHLSLNPKVPVMAYGFDMSNRNHFNGQNVIGKGGNIHGFSSKLWLLPEEKTGLFITTNSITNARDLFFEAFMDHYYPTEPKTDTFLKPTQAELSKFEGLYSQLRTKTSMVKVTATPEGKLLVEDPATGKHELQQVDELLFKDEQGNTLVFQANSDSSIGYLQYLYELSTAIKLENPKPFADVPANSPYASFIHYLQLLSIMQGKENGTLGAAEPVSRGEFAELAAKSLFMTLSKQPVVFADARGLPSASAIQTLYELGVVDGSADASFQPNKPIARQEAATILAKMLQIQGVEPMEAALAGSTDAWAVDNVKLIVALGLFGPEAAQDANGAIDYKSKQPMLRQEAAAMLAQALKL
ncbi:serine hydrolase [Paenibacillus filicis]|uniref:Serine hydrolase n=1 Tax=Paenibacillus filicis TaxID=669464 RepID=A0ABU9DSH2_9BACL